MSDWKFNICSACTRANRRLGCDKGKCALIATVESELAAAREEGRKNLLEALKAANAAVPEEINLSNYNHEDICRISSTWDEAMGIIQAALRAAEESK